jgi:hypothetical protein
VVPSETTIRRALSGADAGALDERLAAWLASGAVPAAVAVAVDGKTLRGAVRPDGRAVHLLAAMTCGDGVVLAHARSGTRQTRSPRSSHFWTRWTCAARW